jgi:PAS domain S-box-containing protein
MTQTLDEKTGAQPQLVSLTAKGSIKVLIIDANRETSHRLKEGLERSRRLQTIVRHAHSLADGLHLLGKEPFDAVLLDVDNPTTSGLDALKRVQASAPNVPVIALTDQADHHLAVEALQAGAQDYLTNAEAAGGLLERAVLYAIERKGAEEAIRHSEHRYEQLVNSLDSIVWEGDARTFQFSFVSEQAERLLGYPLRRWTTEPTFWQDHMHPDDRDWAPNFCAVATAEMRPHQFEYRMIAADGRTVWLRDIVSVVVEGGVPVKLRGVMLDITEQKRAQEDLEQIEDEYRGVFDSTTDGLVINDWDGNVVEVNPAFAAMHGYTREEMIGMPPPNFIHPDSHPLLQQFFDTVKGGQPFECQAMDVRKDGTAFHVDVRGVRFTYKGEPHVLGIVRDTTERVEAFEQLATQEEQYRAIFEATADGLTINTLDGTLVEVNPAFAAMHGYTIEEMKGMDPLTFIHPDDHQYVPEAFAAFREGKEYHRRESRDIRKDGTVFPIEVTGSRFMYRGEPHILCIVRDITERVQTHEELRLKEEQYRAVFEATSDGLAIANLDAIPVEVNPAFAAMHGYTREEILGVHPSAYVHPDSLPLLAEYYEKVRAGERFHTEAIDLRRDGTPFHVEVHEFPITYNGQPHTLAVVRDINERVQAYEKLRLKEEEYRGIFEATTDGISIGDMNGIVAEVNPAFCEMVGYTREELVGKPATLWIHPDSHDQLRDAYATVLAGERWENQGVQVRKDGSTFPVDVICTSFTFRGEPHVLGIIRDATERVQALDLLEQGVAERTQELSTLLDVTHNVASTLELEPLLGRILQQLRLVADYSRASITIGDQELIILSAWGEDPGRPLPEHQPIDWEALGAIGRQLFKGVPVIIDDILSDDPLARLMRDAIAESQKDVSPQVRDYLEAVQREERALMIIPLTLKERNIGGMTLRHKEPGYYSERQARVAVGIGNQAAVAIENARLYRQAQETTRKTAALVQTASQIAFGGSLSSTLEVLCERVASVVGAVASSVVLTDDGTQKMVAAHGLPDGYVDALNRILASGVQMVLQDAFNGREPMYMEDLRQRVLNSEAYAPLHKYLLDANWDGVVAVPMVYRDRAVGVLLSYHPPARTLGDAEITFHNVIADQAAVAVENARLLSQAHEKATLEERQRLARELHDSVTQALFSINLIARSVEVMLQRDGTHSPQTMEKMADLRQLTQGALAEMRALIFELRPGALEEEGLLQALRKHAAAVQGRELVRVDVVADEGALPRLKPAAEEALYRIGQEALHNVVKHAKASRVEVTLGVERAETGEDEVVLRIADDGIGFDARAVPAGHMGLGTMAQRASALGGECKVESTPGGGTVVTAILPLSQWQLHK